MRATELLRFRCLFWRIFFSFWLSSLAIMFATSYVIVSRLESSAFLDRHQRAVERFAEQVIYRYELSGLPPADFQPRRPPPDSPRGHRGRQRAMKILSPEGDVIFLQRIDENEKLAIQLDVVGPSGQSYQVFAPEPPMPQFFKTVIKRLYSVQFIFIFIGSLLVSALLSWAISKPLQQLGKFSRGYTAGSREFEIPVSLLKRGDELGDLARDMGQMTEKIESTLNAQQQLLHDVSHELRAPLARLQATAGLIEQEIDSEHSSRLHNECERINALIQQILNYSRLNRDNESKQITDVVGLVESIVENLQFEYPSREFCIEKTANARPLNLFEEAFSGAVENILRNACKYSPDESKIDIQWLFGQKKFSLSIRDHGPGVTPEDLEKLTQPFYRSGNAMHGEGFGLGLSIAKKAMEKHGGELLIKNHADGGLEVTCNLPEECSH